jgi:hypothetical protein
MKLTDEQLSKFQELYFQNFGIKISKEEALVQGIKLITLVKTISTTLNNYYQKLYDNKPKQ